MDERDYKAMNAEIKREQMTAIEWFYQRILSKDIKEVFEQAKKMEKQQIMNAWLVDGYTDISGDNWKAEFNEYYNETYKNTKE